MLVIRADTVMFPLRDVAMKLATQVYAVSRTPLTFPAVLVRLVLLATEKTAKVKFTQRYCLLPSNKNGCRVDIWYLFEGQKIKKKKIKKRAIKSLHLFLFFCQI